jgi:hypothetical protein
MTSIKSSFFDMADEQRKERLQKCRIIDDIYTECRRVNKSKSKKERSMHLEDFSPGIRILRYYDWRNVHDFDDKCSREQHAVWACRATALQCGGDLTQLRNCFSETQRPPPDSGVPSHVKNYGAVLSYKATAYEPKQRTNDNATVIPCQELQEQMGQCIANNASALAEREAARAQEAKRKGNVQ